ncbi:MAG: peptidoglycan DD-metalloendopeptidase family protein, partial [Clostridia bacterium]|nr:peptidoglycan DD-metalloendopeptidase family protein [Clostridia bacterium]
QRIDVLDGSISQFRPQISALNKQIGNVEDSIDKLSAQIEETQQLAQETQDKLLERIREDYMAGGNATMIEVLLSSEDLSTFLARMELMDRVSESDEQLIKDMEQKADELNSLKEEAAVQKADLQIKKGLLDSKMGELRSNQYDLESSRSAASSKQAALDNRYEQVNEVLSELDEDSEAYQKEIARQRAEMEVLSKEIDNYIAQNGSSQGEEVPEEYLVSRKSANLIWPVPYNNTHVTCHFGYYSNGQPHYGTDIVVRDANGNNISNGKTIVAAQSGKVIRAINNGGYNSGYGNYCIIDHGNGMLTLYAHCRTLTVYEGQIVSQGQKIAEIGLTGNTTGYHLHFEVRIKNADGSVSRVNPENYVSCPG